MRSVTASRRFVRVNRQNYRPARFARIPAADTTKKNGSSLAPASRRDPQEDGKRTVSFMRQHASIDAETASCEPAHAWESVAMAIRAIAERMIASLVHEATQPTSRLRPENRIDAVGARGRRRGNPPHTGAIRVPNRWRRYNRLHRFIACVTPAAHAFHLPHQAHEQIHRRSPSTSTTPPVSRIVDATRTLEDSVRRRRR
ncbi:hypothetical protein QZM22_20470 [Burkholderia oklahomensis]|uniref:hypothetical protein n=1 Tax=Burkholderia oklahomensis TaxID=342113 RepID=UPI00264F3DB5|nr:hypothetical protein [Burkholderia oklahomensis]MDN7674833.1 hypothetical protein [Burkholderia oklahomensis]